MRETTPNRNIRMNYQSMSDAVIHSSLNNIKKKRKKRCRILFASKARQV